jgi:electron transfer flavoprotein alpha subunit
VKETEWEGFSNAGRRQFLNIWVFTEWREGRIRESSLALVGEGRRVAAHFSGNVFGLVPEGQPADEIQRLIAHGADAVMVIDTPLQDFYRAVVVSEAMGQLLSPSEPNMILFCAGGTANEVASYLSVKCRAGLVTDAARIDIEDGRPVVIKNTLGEQIAHKLCIQSNVQLVTIKPKELHTLEYDSRRSGPVKKVEISSLPDASAMELEDCVKGNVHRLDISDADLIIAGGKGVGGRQAFQRIDRLAQLTGAAGVGGSREAVLRGWVSNEQQIGQTGKEVAPRLLIALGISGAIQFLKGMEDAQSVIAVNTDKNAPIFNIADLKIVGDLHEVLSALIHTLERTVVAQENHSK